VGRQWWLQLWSATVSPTPFGWKLVATRESSPLRQSAATAQIPTLTPPRNNSHHNAWNMIPTPHRVPGECAPAQLRCGKYHHNLATGTAPTLEELVDTLRSIEPTADISVGPGVYKHNETWPLPKKGALDSSRAAMAFGYRPNFDLRQGLEAYLAVCRDAKQRISH
jgi:hypothetical protein